MGFVQYGSQPIIRNSRNVIEDVTCEMHQERIENQDASERRGAKRTHFRERANGI